VTVSCSECRFWGTEYDKKVGRATRLCVKHGIYAIGTQKCRLAEHEDPHIREMMREAKQ